MKTRNKRGICILLALCMVFSGLSAVAFAESPQTLPFSDVPQGAWHRSAVEFVYHNNMMQGTSPTTFEPDANMSRIMAAATLFRLEHGRIAGAEDARENLFHDVSASDWFAPYVTWAFNHSIVFGTSPTRFHPHGDVTRQEFATMVYRYAMNMTDLRDGNTSSGQWLQFADRGRVATWAYNALRWMNFHAIVTGSTATTINPTGATTRAEAAMMIMRFMRESERLSADFVLTISVEEATLPQGEGFRANVTLKNNSGADQTIVYSILFWSHIPNWNPFGCGYACTSSRYCENPIAPFEMPEPRPRFFPADDTIQTVWSHLGGGINPLPPGTHELRFTADFHLRLQDTSLPIRVTSNTIILTVQ